MHVFDHTIKPILLYGCEIWGTFNTFSAKFRHGMQNLSFDQIYCKQKAELLHQKFCKYILGVHKKSTNFAVLSELGRFPLHFNVIKAMIRYYDRLKKIEEMFPLLHAAYKESISIDDSNHASWFSSIQFISNKIAQSLDLKNNKISNAILNKFFINEWNKNKEKFSDGKLSTYLTVKNNFGFEKYLDKIKNFEQRRTLTRFRISAHKLAIETGRYKGIPRHDRICTRCTDNTVEDERHFLFSCNYHTQEREALMSIINENCKNFSLLNIDAKLVWLLNNENIDILCALCTFLKHI